MSPALTRTAVEDAVAAVRPGRSDADPDTVFAAGAWTVLTEAGDGVAGAFVGAMGAAAALDAVRREAPPSRRPELRSGFERWRVRYDPLVIQRAFRNAAHLGVRLLVPGDPDWPAGLADLDAHAPIALWALAPTGQLPDLRRSVGLVGTRDPSDYGKGVAMDLSCGVADRGFAIISGAAFGVDGIAHRGALASGGLTAAVLACGLDRFYPASHADLLRRIAAEGVVLSEMPCGVPPAKWRFKLRNRLIAAMSRATVVVEAAQRSGALNTAAHAATLGRPIGAVPGSVHSPMSAGCHLVLREYGGVVVRHAADVAELAADPDDRVVLDGLELPEDPLERRVRDVLTRTPMAVVDLARRTGLAPSEVRSALGMLALTGAARETERGWSRA